MTGRALGGGADWAQPGRTTCDGEISPSDSWRQAWPAGCLAPAELLCQLPGARNSSVTLMDGRPLFAQGPAWKARAAEFLGVGGDRTANRIPLPLLSNHYKARALTDLGINASLGQEPFAQAFMEVYKK